MVRGPRQTGLDGMDPNYHGGHSISSSPVSECSFQVGFREVSTKVGLTHGETWRFYSSFPAGIESPLRQSNVHFGKGERQGCMGIDKVAVLKLHTSLLSMATYWVDGARRMAYDIKSYAQVPRAETIYIHEEGRQPVDHLLGLSRFWATGCSKWPYLTE